MKWLLTFPEDERSIPIYRGWLERGGVGAGISLLDAPLPDPSRFDALLLPGGGDVDPARYGAAVHPRTGDMNPAQDEREILLIDKFLSAGKPVFGICRGLQILNVALGGRLIQHVPDVAGSEAHRINDTLDAKHGLAWETAARLAGALRQAPQANSSHHQAVDPDGVGRGLVVAARSPAGIIEAMESLEAGTRLSAVQWHPERLADDDPASGGLREFWKSLM